MKQTAQLSVPEIRPRFNAMYRSEFLSHLTTLKGLLH